jgi:hypothetical protein
VLYSVDHNVFTFPNFTNGDREVVFEEWIEVDGVDTANLWRLPLAADRLSAVGDPLFFVPNSQSPKAVIVASDELGSSTAVAEEAETPLPAAFSLAQNYPNPFNATTLISYAVPSASRVVLDIFNVRGQRVASLDEGLRTAGAHAVRWSGIDAAGRPLASGVYFYRLRLPTAVPAAALATHKMLLLR